MTFKEKTLWYIHFSVINNKLLPGNNIPEENFMSLVDIPKKAGSTGEAKNYFGSYSPSTFSTFKTLPTNVTSTITSIWTTPRSISAVLSYHTNSKSVSQLLPGHFHNNFLTPLQTYQTSNQIHHLLFQASPK